MSLAVARNYPSDCGAPVADPSRGVFAKSALSNRLYQVLAVAQARQTSGSFSGETTFKDKVYSTLSSASFVTDYDIRIVPLAPNYAFRGAVESQGSNLTVQGAGSSFFGTFVSAGTATLLVSDSRGQKTIVRLPLVSSVAQSAYVFARYATGSLAAHLLGLLDRLASQPSLNVFSTQNPATLTYIRNPSCWISGIDITSKGVWNTAGGFGMGGCLLTRRHAVFTAHYGYHPSVGTQIHFVGRDAAAGQPEQVAVRTVSNVNSAIGNDQCIVRLLEPVPEFITPAKVLPPNTSPSVYTSFATYVPRERAENQIALFAPNIKGDGDLCVAGFFIDRNNVAGLRLPRVQNRSGWIGYSAQDYAAFLQYAQEAVPGDSGSPVFLVVNNSAVYLGNHTGVASGSVLLRDAPEQIPNSSASEISPLKNIRDQIAAWGDSDVIETVDLSGFPTY